MSLAEIKKKKKNGVKLTKWEQFQLDEEKRIQKKNAKILKLKEELIENHKHIKCYKDGRYLKWEKPNGDYLHVDLKDGSRSIKIEGRDGNINAFLENVDGKILLELFQDELWKKFLLMAFEKQSYYGYNESRLTERNKRFANLMRLMPECIQTQTMIAMGLNARKLTYEFDVKDLHKDLIWFLKEAQTPLEGYGIDRIYNTESTRTLLNNIARHLREHYEFDYRGMELINALATDEYSLRDIITLTDTYNYEYKRLVDYLVYVVYLEALSVRNAVTYLKDYARANTMMQIDDFDKYPKMLKTRHDIASQNAKAFQNKYKDYLFKEHIREDLVYESEKFLIVPPNEADEIRDEGARLNHCVHTYIDRVIEGHTCIVFMREKKKPEAPLVTVEIRDNAIVQARGKYNRATTPQESEFLKQFAKEKTLEVSAYTLR